MNENGVWSDLRWYGWSMFLSIIFIYLFLFFNEKGNSESDFHENSVNLNSSV